MSASKQQLAASAYHIKPSDVRKLLLSANNFRDRCLIKTLWWLGVRRHELISLDVRDLDAERKRVTIHKGKGPRSSRGPLWATYDGKTRLKASKAHIFQVLRFSSNRDRVAHPMIEASFHYCSITQ